MADHFEMKKTTAVHGSYIAWAGVVLLTGLLFFLYKPVFKYLLYRIGSASDFDYIYLAPLVLAYLVWELRHDLAAAPKTPAIKGCLLFLFGLMLFWLGELGGEFYTQFVSFLVLIAAMVWALLGTAFLKRMAFVFVCALFFLPFPNFIVQAATARLQLVSSTLGVMLLRLLGKSVFREGNIIDLGYSQLQVVEACSGLRYVLPLLILALLMGHLLRLRMWKRLVLFTAAIPVAVLANGLRITATALLMEHFGKKAVEGFFHDFEGFFIFFFALACMSGLSALLNLLFKDAPNPVNPGHKDSQSQAASNPWQPRKAYLALGIMLASMIGSCYAYSFINFREAIPAVRPLDQFPTQLGQWNGKKAILQKKFLDALDLSGYILIDYADKQGRPINFYVAYYESQRKGESIHSPATCLRGSGWVFERAGAVTLDLPKVGKIKIRAATLVKDRQKQLVYYWFQKGGRVIDNVWALKWYVFWDALTRQMTDGALVRIIAPVMPNETESDTRRRMNEFLSRVVPVLNQYLPGA